MWRLIVCLLLLGLIAMTWGYLRNRYLRKQVSEGKLEALPEVKEVDGECCGQHSTCEKESLLAAVSRRIEYFDDEELDNYIGIPATAYSEEQIEAFRTVLYTMREVEVAAWTRSLQLRGLELPDALKDEVLLIVGERRFSV